MSSLRSSASLATRSASPEERSSITVTPWPSPSRASTTCEPMKPAPPVTIARGVTRGNLQSTARARARRAAPRPPSPTRRCARAPAFRAARPGDPRRTAAPLRMIGMSGWLARSSLTASSTASTAGASVAPRTTRSGDWLSTSATSCSTDSSVSKIVWYPAAASWSCTICSPSVCGSPSKTASSTRSRVGSVPPSM